MMAQPPYDDKLAPFYILHYTYGMDYTLQGEFTPGERRDWGGSPMCAATCAALPAPPATSPCSRSSPTPHTAHPSLALPQASLASGALTSARTRGGHRRATWRSRPPA